MKRFHAWGLAVLALLSGCNSPSPVADLAENSDLYRDVAFATKLPGDRSVFVTPVADERRPEVLPAAQGAFPIAYDGDQRWLRPVAEMVDDILRRELQQSGLFTALREQAVGADLVIKPSLAIFSIGVMEVLAGARSLCEVALRVQVFGPATPSGERPVLHDQLYGDRHVTGAMRLPPNRSALIGGALRNTMQRLLQGLDGANVGRAGVPAGPVPAR